MCPQRIESNANTEKSGKTENAGQYHADQIAVAIGQDHRDPDQQLSEVQQWLQETSVHGHFELATVIVRLVPHPPNKVARGRKLFGASATQYIEFKRTRNEALVRL